VHLQKITGLRYISAAYYPFEAVMVNQFQGSTTEGDGVLETLSFSRPFYMSALVLLGYLGVLHILIYLGLLLVARRERR
jgi:hypothetical protein